MPLTTVQVLYLSLVNVLTLAGNTHAICYLVYVPTTSPVPWCLHNLQNSSMPKFATSWIVFVLCDAELSFTPDPFNASKLSHAERELQSLMETTKSTRESSLIANENIKSIYSYLHHISSTNSVPSHVYTTDSTHFTCNNLETAESFNSFFHSTFTVSMNCLYLISCPHQTNNFTPSP
jgi:hypothetical protein